MKPNKTSNAKLFFKEDSFRHHRTVVPEIIYCQNKSLDNIIKIAKTILKTNSFVLGTRCPSNYLKTLKKTFPKINIINESNCFRIGTPLKNIYNNKVALISAGTTDIAVCEEAALVLESLGIPVERIYDVGVAGIHRLFAQEKLIKNCDVIIVAAGMEGALPSVVAGLYTQPIIAIPTSTGYGAALFGFTALFAMLTSCSPGVTVVNIDNGVGAAAAACKILNLINKSA